MGIALHGVSKGNHAAPVYLASGEPGLMANDIGGVEGNF